MRIHLTLAALMAMLASNAVAQTVNCGPRERVVERLSAAYHEAFAGGGMQTGDAVFEIWVAQDGSTWTILRTDASGISCIMAAGTDWFPGVQAPQTTGVPS